MQLSFTYNFVTFVRLNSSSVLYLPNDELIPELLEKSVSNFEIKYRGEFFSDRSLTACDPTFTKDDDMDRGFI